MTTKTKTVSKPSVFMTNDGQIIKSKNDRDLIHQLRDQSFTESANDKEFMADVAERIRMQTGSIVSTDSPEEFVAGLLDSGFIKEAPQE